jgi:hypothetical protein
LSISELTANQLEIVNQTVFVAKLKNLQIIIAVSTSIIASTIVFKTVQIFETGRIVALCNDIRNSKRKFSFKAFLRKIVLFKINIEKIKTE